MNRKTWLPVIILAPVFLTACFLAACGPKENCAQSHDPRNTRTLWICINGEKYDFAEPIHITFTVTNISDDPLTLDDGDKPAIDIRVEGEHWSDGRELTPRTNSRNARAGRTPRPELGLAYLSDGPR